MTTKGRALVAMPLAKVHFSTVDGGAMTIGHPKNYGGAMFVDYTPMVWFLTGKLKNYYNPAKAAKNSLLTELVY